MMVNPTRISKQSSGTLASSSKDTREGPVKLVAAEDKLPLRDSKAERKSEYSVRPSKNANSLGSKSSFAKSTCTPGGHVPQRNSALRGELNKTHSTWSGEERSGLERELWRPISASSISSVSQELNSPSYLALVKLFNQFQGMPVESTKVLVTVTVLGSIGGLKMLVAADATVVHLIESALCVYAREGRLPVLGFNLKAFELYLSPYSPQALPSQQSIKELGTRNFVLCPAKLPELQSEPKMSRDSRSWWSVISSISFISAI
ncbi:hypothetical protein O6H91_07G009300 [Diphasiastrum complanatum]|uniref:Uncharacterized protein n=1 Tax=Diphasiastrum complanatum TaxID=34168 RepID=A0ACC2D333_DIPCM|nr:hypothetical protein O6H91_07G009300 [Diphasiastrum complanatum]